MTHLLNKTAFLIAFAVAVTLFVTPTSQVSAQQGFLSDANATNAGLTVAWTTQARISVKAELADWQLVVDENRATTYFVISYGKRKEIIGEKDISPFKVPYGIEGAMTAAKNRKEVIEYGLKNDGKEDVKVEITSYQLPHSTLYALGASGRVICLDADTGATRWVQQVGDSRLPSVGLGASKTHVAVANGSSVYCLEAETGRVLWGGRCKNAIDSSPTCSETSIHVPLVTGRLQTFPIDKFGIGSFSRVAQGGSRARPLVTENNVIWTTEKGHMNVAPLDRRTVAYRLKTSAPIVSQAASSGDRLFVGSLDGFVYGVNETTGRLDWDVSTGRGILNSPVPFGKDLYVVSRANELFKIDSEAGTFPQGWQSPARGVKTIAGFGVDTIYCLNANGQLIGIDRETQAVTKSIQGARLDLVMPNRITDRMFFATRNGFIQCVHETSSVRPRFLESDLAVAKPMMDKKREDDSAIGEASPFGEDNDGKNPFGDDDGDGDAPNPFGDDSSDDEDEDDGSNPFG